MPVAVSRLAGWPSNLKTVALVLRSLLDCRAGF
jgi:hypothetical protein